MAETELPTASSTFDVQKDLRRQAEGKKWDSRALRLQDAIIRNPRVDYLAGILEEESGDEGEDNDAYTEVVALFEDFNLPPVRTMSILQRLRGYMSGSGVLATERRRLDLPSFEPKDLDFYLQEQASHCFRDFLLESGERQFWKEVDFTKRSDLATGLSEEHAYTAGDTTWTASGSQSEGISKKEGQLRISKLWYFRDARGKEINVIVTASRCALVPIVAFHSMPVMNFVTYFGIVSLYGSLTELGLGWVNRDLKSKPLSPQDQEWLDKYADRGYLLSEDSNIPGPFKAHRCRLDEECTLTIRHLFDKGVKVTKFPRYRGEDNLTLLKTLEPVFTWKLQNSACKVKEEAEETEDRRGFIKTVDEYYRM